MNKYLLIAGALFILIGMFMVIGIGTQAGNRITAMLIGSAPASLSAGSSALDLLNSTYSLIPLVEVRTGYSLDEYERLAAEAKAIVAKCRGTEEATVETCVNDEIATLQGWKIAERNDFTYKFDVVKSSLIIMVYDEAAKKLVDKQVTYRFALDLSG